EALKALATVDSSSVQFEQAQQLRKANATRAAEAYVEDARRMLPDDADGARAKLSDALSLDPSNADAASMLAKLKSGVMPTAVAAKEPVETAPVAPKTSPQHPKDDGLATVKVPKQTEQKKPKGPKDPKEPANAPRAGGGALSGAALAAYKN